LRISRWLLPLLLLVAFPLAAPVGAGEPSRIDWRDWDRGLAEAHASGRPVLVDVYTDWCGWCRRMKADVYTRAEIREYLADHFVAVELNAEASNPARYEGRSFTSRSLAARFGVSGYPTTIFLRPNGEHLVNVPGYVDSGRFLTLLRYIGEGHMDRGVSFREFARRPADASPKR